MQMHADVQERSWALHEDPAETVELLNEFNGLLQKADRRVPTRILREEDDGRHLERLIDLYQMEQRRMIRNALLESFRSICLLDPALPSYLVDSVLPVELWRELQESSTGKGAERSDEVVSKCLDLISLMYCTGTPMPIQHEDILDGHFVTFLADHCDQGGLNGLISFNLQFRLSGNRVVEALTGDLKGRTVTPNLVTLVNRKTDPTWRYGDSSMCSMPKNRRHAVIKLLSDLLEGTHGVDCFYSNDLEVLLDVCLREIHGLPPGRLRSEFLGLLRAVMAFVPSHRLKEVGHCVDLIEIDSGSSSDAVTVDEIKEFMMSTSAKEEQLNGFETNGNCVLTVD